MAFFDRLAEETEPEKINFRYVLTLILMRKRKPLAATLFAVDELSGLLTAAALVQPNKTIHEVKVKSVKKKFKDKSFARAVNRDHIRTGMEELGVEFGEHLEFCIDALKGVAEELGLG